MTTATTTATAFLTQQEIGEILSHPMGFLVEIRTTGTGGYYPSRHPLAIVGYPSDGFFLRAPFKRGDSPDISFNRGMEILSRITPEEAVAWAQKNARHGDEFLSTRPEDEVRFWSPAKQWWENHGTEIHIPTKEDAGLTLDVKWGMTSFTLILGCRAGFCPGATDLRPENLGEKALRKYAKVAYYSWAENGSGFNKKFIEAHQALQQMVKGDWSGWEPFFQNNRTTSYSFKHGESVSFWGVQYTFPEKLREKLSFPLVGERYFSPI